MRRLGRFAAIAGAAILLTSIPVVFSGILIFGDPIFSKTALGPEVLDQEFGQTTNCYTRYSAHRFSTSIEATDYCWGAKTNNPFYFPPPTTDEALANARPHWTDQRIIDSTFYGITLTAYPSADFFIKGDPGFYPGRSKIELQPLIMCYCGGFFLPTKFWDPYSLRPKAISVIKTIDTDFPRVPVPKIAISIPQLR